MAQQIQSSYFKGYQDSPTPQSKGETVRKPTPEIEPDKALEGGYGDYLPVNEFTEDEEFATETGDEAQNPYLEGYKDNFEGDKATQDISLQEIKKLYNEVKSGNTQPEGGEITLEECLKILETAIQDEKAGNDAASAQGFAKVTEALGKGDPEDQDADLEEKLGTLPTEKKGKIYTYDGKKLDDSVSLTATDEGLKHVIKDAKEVTLTPKDPKNDAVTLSQSGNEIVVKMGKDEFHLPADANLTIMSDKVTGNIENKDKKITIGGVDMPARPYISTQKLADLATKIQNGAGQISSITYYQALGNGMGYAYNSAGEIPNFKEPSQDQIIGQSINFGGNDSYPTYAVKPSTKYAIGWHGTKYSSDLGVQIQTGTPEYHKSIQNEIEDSQKCLNAIAGALRETDPKKQNEAWEKAIETVGRVMSETGQPGSQNNKAQLIFNVLYGELGEDGLKQALKEGLIPKEMAEILATSLEILTDENKNKDTEIDAYQIGGPDWNHSTCAEFLRNHSSGKSSND